MWVFGAKHVKLLTEHLARVQLPGLTSLDQMYLVALADVVASIRQEGIHTKSFIKWKVFLVVGPSVENAKNALL